MKEFLKTNTITYNLMSFTAFKSMLAFSLLVDGPKTYAELKQSFAENEYLHEKISTDTLRVYLNSLREMGCKISRKTIQGKTKYYMDSHPFSIQFSKKQINSIIKVYKALSKNIEVPDLITLQNFFAKISNYIDDDELKEKLAKISPLYEIDKDLVIELMKHAQNNSEIIIDYNSKTTTRKNICVVVDKIYVSNSKLYISGINSEHNNYYSFLVNRIKKIVSINSQNKTLEIPKLTVGYQYIKEDNEQIQLLNNENIVKADNNNITIEITSSNKFEIMQRILSHSTKCKVLYPEDFKNYIVLTLKKMKEGYLEKK